MDRPQIEMVSNTFGVNRHSVFLRNDDLVTSCTSIYFISILSLFVCMHVTFVLFSACLDQKCLFAKSISHHYVNMSGCCFKILTQVKAELDFLTSRHAD